MTRKMMTVAAMATMIAAMTTSCGNNVSEQTQSTSEAAPVATTATTDNSNENVIEYMVYLKPQDMRDPDAHELYDAFNREAFVDSVFAAVYQHHAKVTDESGNELTLEEIKEREVSDPRYAHDKVAAIRFREAWSFDPASKTMTKKVKSMLVGYEFVDDSVIIAMRPAFLMTFDN